MQRVDPFIPISPRGAKPVLSAPKTPQLVKYAARPITTAGGSASAKPSTRPAPTQLVAMVTKAPIEPDSQARPKEHKSINTHSKLRILLLTVAVLAAGMLVQVQATGEALIVIYAVYALIRQVASRTTFMLVLVSLATIMLLHVLGKDAQLASNFAVYSLLLSFIGVISLAYEVRSSQK